MLRYYVEIDGMQLCSCSTQEEAARRYAALKKDLLPGQFIALVGRDLDQLASVPIYYRHDWRQRRPQGPLL